MIVTMRLFLHWCKLLSIAWFEGEAMPRVGTARWAQDGPKHATLDFHRHSNQVPPVFMPSARAPDYQRKALNIFPTLLPDVKIFFLVFERPRLTWQ